MSKRRISPSCEQEIEDLKALIQTPTFRAALAEALKRRKKQTEPLRRAIAASQKITEKDLKIIVY